MSSTIYTPANNRLRLLTFDKNNISLFDSKSGRLIEISLPSAKVLRMIDGEKDINDIYNTLMLTDNEQRQVGAQLKKLTKWGFLVNDLKKNLSLAGMRKIDNVTCIHPPLKALIFHVTKRCNINCIHCYMDAGFNKENSDLSFTEIHSVLECFSNMGGLSVDITGGEPLTRADILEIIDLARKLRIHVRLLSNGILLKNRNLAIKAGDLSDEIILSLDGLKDTHNWIRNGDYYDTVVEVSRFLVANKYRVGITTLLTHKSLFELPQIAELLVDIGVEKWNLNLPRPVGRADIDRKLSNETFHEYFTDHENTLSFLRKAYQIATNGNVLVMGELSMFPKEIREKINWEYDPFYKLYEKNRACCNSTLCIFSNGDIVPCLFFPNLVYGNVKNTSLSQLCAGDARQSVLMKFTKRAANAICPAIITKEKKGDENPISIV